MMEIVRHAELTVAYEEKYQIIDGFGVNINSKYWNDGALRPVVDFLVDDLGAVLFRVDGYGNANWIDPNNDSDATCLCEDCFARVYQSADFQNMLGLCKHLNARGIEPYITVSGVVPTWMCAEDGVTLLKFDWYAQMLADYAFWLRQCGVVFHLFGPLNETDLGPPEGPFVSPASFCDACRAVVRQLDLRGMQDVKLVVSEQNGAQMDYVKALLSDPDLCDRIAVTSMHLYGDWHVDSFVRYVAQHAPHVHPWITEFGDLDQSTAREEQIAWSCLKRLFMVLEDGAQGALFWDAFDNYHDHDHAWTTFGLLKNAWDVYIPKKRYYALKHIFRFVRPGFQRIGAYSTLEHMPFLAFADETTGAFTAVGMNPLNEGIHVNLNLGWFAPQDGLKYLQFDAFRTNHFEDCACVTTPVINLKNRGGQYFTTTLLPHSIFTITNITKIDSLCP